MAALPPPPNSSHLQQMLQLAVQIVQWTYGIFWQFCPQQGMLMWAEGYYNGDIKTRKTVQTIEASAEEASVSALQRSQQLRELYFSLLAGESNQQQPPARRLCAALSPEDLTELEWFYLLCISFSFPPGVGLPGKVFEKGHHIWLTNADEVDSRIFSRSILAKSAHIQTVVCIPSMDGVVELGFTENIQENPPFIQQVKQFFINHQGHHHDHDHDHDHDDHHSSPPLGQQPICAFTAHSTLLSTSTDEFHFPLVPIYAMPNAPPSASNRLPAAEKGDYGELDAKDSDLELKMGEKISQRLEEPNHVDPIDPGDLMQLEFFDDIGLSSPDYASDNLDSEFKAVTGSQLDDRSQLSHHQTESFQDVDLARRRTTAMQQHEPLLICKDCQSSGGGPILDKLTSLDQADTHYSQILSTILKSQCCSSTTSTATSPASTSHLSSSPNTAFLKWTFKPNPAHLRLEGTSQFLLKYALFTVPYLHTKQKQSGRDPPKTALAGSFPGPRKLDELSTSHVLAERRRREKLNERFIILRSLVPFVTKTDKASILGETIEYLKHLRNKIQDLEMHERQMEHERVRLANGAEKDTRYERTKVRVVDNGSEGGKPMMVEVAAGKLEVSIIENDALVELHCLHREGLLLDVMLTLRDLMVEVTAVQSSLHDAHLIAELRAKVKENNNGKKASIMEVKKAIKQIVPESDS